MNQNSSSSVASPFRRGPNLFWPIVLIGVGVILLLWNIGVITANPLPILWRLWPVILIVIGVDILFGRRGALGAVVSALLGVLVVGSLIALLLAVQYYPTLVKTSPLFAVPQMRTEHIAQPLGQVRSANVEIDLGSGQGQLSALVDSPNLVEADVRTFGQVVNTFQASADKASLQLGTRNTEFGPMFFGEDERMDIRLNSSVSYDMTVNSGSGSHALDMSSLNLTGLDINHGSGSVTLSLPKSGQYRFALNVGSGSVVVNAPSGVAFRVQARIGSGSFSAPSLSRVSGNDRDGSYESANFASSDSKVTIDLQMGSGSVVLRQ